jgi:hypothetical protein
MVKLPNTRCAKGSAKPWMPRPDSQAPRTRDLNRRGLRSTLLTLMREQARSKNTESIDIASNMLAAWQKLSANHLSTDNTALNNAVLSIERMEMERHLRAAFKAEEAKKLVSGGAK